MPFVDANGRSVFFLPRRQTRGRDNCVSAMAPWIHFGKKEALMSISLFFFRSPQCSDATAQPDIRRETGKRVEKKGKREKTAALCVLEREKKSDKRPVVLYRARRSLYGLSSRPYGVCKTRIDRGEKGHGQILVGMHHSFFFFSQTGTRFVLVKGVEKNRAQGERTTGKAAHTFALLTSKHGQGRRRHDARRQSRHR